MQNFMSVKNSIALLGVLMDAVYVSDHLCELTYYEFIHAIIYDEPNEIVTKEIASKIKNQIYLSNNIDIKILGPREILRKIRDQAALIACRKFNSEILSEENLSEIVDLFAIARCAIFLDKTVARKFSYEDEESMPENDPRHPHGRNTSAPK